MLCVEAVVAAQHYPTMDTQPARLEPLTPSGGPSLDVYIAGHVVVPSLRDYVHCGSNVGTSSSHQSVEQGPRENE